MFGVVGWVLVGACTFDKHPSRSSPGGGGQRPPALKHSDTKLFLRTTPVNNIQKYFANAPEALEQIAPPMLKSVHRQANTENLKPYTVMRLFLMALGLASLHHKRLAASKKRFVNRHRTGFRCTDKPDDPSPKGPQIEGRNPPTPGSAC